MPGGKPAGVRCVQLDADNRCRIYGLPERPAVCSRLRARVDMCGASRQEALANLVLLERATAPAPRAPRASDPHDPRRDRDPREPIDPPARREPEDDPEQGPPPEPPIEDPLDAPGAGEPAWRDPTPREPPRLDP